MEKTAKNRRLRHFRIALTITCIAAMVVYLIVTPGVTVDNFLDALIPENLWAAAAVLLVLYTVKGITAFFPLIILQIICGHLFPWWAALGVNLAGLLILMVVPYWFGRAAGMDFIDEEIQKHPRLLEFQSRKEENSFFLCFFLRIVGFLPVDIITMYFGASRTSFWKNLVAGTLGLLPRMILATLLGGSIRDTSSPVFWGSLFLNILLAVLSVVFYYFYRKKNRHRQRKHSHDLPGFAQ